MKTIRKKLFHLYNTLIQKTDESLNKLHQVLEQYGFEYFNEMPPMVKIKSDIKNKRY